MSRRSPSRESISWTRIVIACTLITVDSKTTRVSLQLTQLRRPDQAQALVDVVLHADLDSATLQAIRAAAAARLSQQEDPFDLPALRARQKAELYVAMKERVFGAEMPSIGGLRQYCKHLVKDRSTTYDQKKEICKTVNFWKGQLNAEFLYEGRVCNIAAKSPDGNQGGYMLRAPRLPGTIYAAAAFPKLTIRTRT